MKHITPYIITENFIHEFRKGDYVILLYSNEEGVEYGYIAGQMYQIAQVDNTDYKFPYRLTKINETDSEEWVTSDAIRQATDYEISALKYNL